MSFVPENELENSLMRAASDAAQRPEFYRLLLEADIYVIGRVGSEPPGHEQMVVNAGDRLMIASVAFKDRNYHPIFSSLSRLRAFDDSVAYLALNGRALFENTRGAYFLLNPGSDYGKELLPAEVAHLLDPSSSKRQTITIEQPTKVRVGQPKVYPDALVAALKVMFARRPEVIAAYLVQIAFEDGDTTPHPLIGIETVGDWDSLSRELGSILNGAGQIVDVMQIDRSDTSDVMRALIESQPFYSRKLPTV